MREKWNENEKNRALRDFLCGVLIGAGAILPGVSGGVLAVVFGIYRPLMEMLTRAGYRVGNIDATIVAQAPKMASHLPAMAANMAADLGVEVGCVNVKATTEEHLGFTGTGEGIAAHAVCLLLPTASPERE